MFCTTSCSQHVHNVTESPWTEIEERWQPSLAQWREPTRLVAGPALKRNEIRLGMFGYYGTVQILDSCCCAVVLFKLQVDEFWCSAEPTKDELRCDQAPTILFCWEYEEYMWIFELNYGEIRWQNQLDNGWSVFSLHWGWTWYIHMLNSDFEWMRYSNLKFA